MTSSNRARATLADGELTPQGPPDLRCGTLAFGAVEIAVLSYAVSDDTSLLSCLTTAEREVVLLLREGHSNTEIAKCRGRSVRTITNQLRSVYLKMQVSSRSELLAKLSHGDIAGAIE